MYSSDIAVFREVKGYFVQMEKNVEITEKKVSKANDLHGRPHEFSDFRSESRAKYVLGIILARKLQFCRC